MDSATRFSNHKRRSVYWKIRNETWYPRYLRTYSYIYWKLVQMGQTQICAISFKLINYPNELCAYHPFLMMHAIPSGDHVSSCLCSKLWILSWHLRCARVSPPNDLYIVCIKCKHHIHVIHISQKWPVKYRSCINSTVSTFWRWNNLNCTTGSLEQTIFISSLSSSKVNIFRFILPETHEVSRA